MPQTSAHLTQVVNDFIRSKQAMGHTEEGGDGMACGSVYCNYRRCRDAANEHDRSYQYQALGNDTRQHWQVE